MDGSAGKTLDMLPPSQAADEVWTDGRTREDGDGDHLSRRNLGRRAGAGAEKDANLIETAAAVLCPRNLKLLGRPI